MDNQKIYLMAEVTVLPEFLDDVKRALKQEIGRASCRERVFALV